MPASAALVGDLRAAGIAAVVISGAGPSVLALVTELPDLDRWQRPGFEVAEVAVCTTGAGVELAVTAGRRRVRSGPGRGRRRRAAIAGSTDGDTRQRQLLRPSDGQLLLEAITGGAVTPTLQAGHPRWGRRTSPGAWTVSRTDPSAG